MALIKCPECGKDISDTAKVCIHCGYKLGKRKREKVKNESNKKVLIGIVVLVIIVIIIAVSFFIKYRIENAVPSVLNMSEIDAKALLVEKSMDFDIQYEYTFDYDKGIVYAQDTEPQSQYKEGSPIVLMVSLGRKYVVPDLLGKTLDEVKQLLPGIEFEILGDFTDEYEKDIIYRASVKAETEICDGDSMKLYVSKGKYKEVPIARGTNGDEAIKVLEELGLIVDAEYVYTSNGMEGDVVNFSPHKYVNVGDKINIVISKGAGIQVPDVCELSEQEAIKKLEEAGFGVRVEYDYTDDLFTGAIYTNCSEQKATVMEQSVKGYVGETCDIVLRVLKKGILITDIDWDINYVGGIDTYVYFKNVSDKEIAYVDMEVKYYDRMGNPAKCSIKGSSIATLSFTGPLKPGKNNNGTYWDAVIYNNTVEAIQPVSCKVKYSDGTTQQLEYDGMYWYGKNFHDGGIND